MKVYLKDYLSRSVSGDKVTTAFHYIDSNNRANGYLLGLLSVTSHGPQDASNIAKFVWNGVINKFKEGVGDISNIENLKVSIAEGESQLRDLIKNDPIAEKAGVELNFALAHFVSNKVLFGFYGDTSIHIHHDDEIVNISDLLIESSVNVGSTRVELDDVLFMVSPGNKIYEILGSGASLKSLLDYLESNDINLGDGVLLSSLGTNLQLNFANKEEQKQAESKVIAKEVKEGNAENKTENLNDEYEDSSSETYESKGFVDNSVESIESDNQNHTVLIQDENVDEQANRFLLETFKSNLAQVIYRAKVIVRASLKYIYPYYTKVTAILAKRATSLNAWFSRYMLNKYGRKTWFKKLRAKVSQSRISSVSPRDFKIGSYQEKSLRQKRFMILGSITLLLVAGYMGFNAAQEMREQRETNRVFDEIYSQVDTSLQLAEQKSKSDPTAAETSLLTAERNLDELDIEKESLRVEDRDRLKKLEQRVLGVNDTLGKVEPISEGNRLRMYLDLKSVSGSSNTRPSDIAIYADESTAEYLVLTDVGAKAVYTIPIRSKQVQRIPDPDSLISEPLFVDVGQRGIYVFDNKQGVLFAPFESGKSKIAGFQKMSGVSRTDFKVINPTGFAVFTINDNLYLLDGSGGIIYKADRSVAGSYTLPYIYLQDEQIKGATDFFADFTVYVTTTQNSYFYRYAFSQATQRLASSPVAVIGVRRDLSPITAGFTGSSLNQKVYLFESESRNILAFQKPNEPERRHPGEILLKEQYAYRGDKENMFSNVLDLVVTNNERELFILDGNTIYSIELL